MPFVETSSICVSFVILIRYLKKVLFSVSSSNGESAHAREKTSTSRSADSMAAGILTVAMVEEKQSVVSRLPFLATASLLSLVQQTSNSNC